MSETKLIETTETKLKRIANVSRKSTDAKFNWLMPHFTKQALIDCFYKLDGKKAVGVDRVTKEEYGKNLEKNIENLIHRMKKMAYRPGPVREVMIPKEGKKNQFRPLGISNFEDKIVQLLISKILEAIYEPIFSFNSFGFRPQRSCHTAILCLYRHLNKSNYDVIIDVDLKNFFGTINHKTLIKFLRININDEKFLRYIVRMLKAGVLSDGELKMTLEGSPQGNVASPILANIYGHYVIDIWFENVVKKHTKGAVEVFRYCDDIVICCQYQNDALKIKRSLKGRLEKYSLKLNLEKTKFVKFSKADAEKGIKQETFDFLGFTFYLAKSKKGRIIPKTKTASKRITSKLKIVKDWCKKQRGRMKLREMWAKFTVKLNGHIRYYGVSFNSKHVATFVFQAIKIFFKWVNRRSQRKSFNWEKFNLFLMRFPPPPVKVYHSLFC